MAEAKKKPTSRKRSPSRTSKPTEPVILNNRPILQEPVVVAGLPNVEDKGEAIQVRHTSEVKLQPLSAPLLPDDALPIETRNTKTAKKPVVKPKAAAAKPPAKPKPAVKKAPPNAAPANPLNKPEPVHKPVVKPAKPVGPEPIEPTDTTPPPPDGEAGEKVETVKPPATAEAAVKAAPNRRMSNLQALVDSKQYYLPINSVERRRAQRFVVFGLLLSLILAVAWVDIALDAGLIHIDHVKAYTHFFSN